MSDEQNNQMVRVGEVQAMIPGGQGGSRLPAMASTALAVMRHEWTQEEKDIIRNSICADADEAAFRWFLAAAEASALNPIQREIYMVKYGSRFVLQTGIDGFLKHAERSGKFGGFEPTRFTVKNKQGELEIVEIDHYDPDSQKLISCTVRMHRKDIPGETRQATCLFTEYAVSYNGKLSDRWLRAGARQLEKCTQAKVIRENCPGLGQVYVHEEMEQARATGDYIDAEFAATGDVTTTQAQPTRRTRKPRTQTLLPPQEQPVSEPPAEPEVSAEPVEQSTAQEQEATVEPESAPEALEGAAIQPDGSIVDWLNLVTDKLNANFQLASKEGATDYAEFLIKEKFSVTDPMLVPGDRLKELQEYCRGEWMDKLAEKGFVPKPDRSGK